MVSSFLKLSPFGTTSVQFLSVPLRFILKSSHSRTTSVYFIAKNGLSASRSIIFTQGTGVTDFTLTAGKSALIYADGSDEVHNAFKDFYIETLQTTSASTEATYLVFNELIAKFLL